MHYLCLEFSMSLIHMFSHQSQDFQEKTCCLSSNGPCFVYKVKILQTFKVFIFFKLAATSKEIKIIFFQIIYLKRLKKIFCWYYLTKIMFYFLMVFSNKLTLRMYLLFLFLKEAGYLRRCNFSKYIHTLPHM